MYKLSWLKQVGMVFPSHFNSCVCRKALNNKSLTLVWWYSLVIYKSIWLYKLKLIPLILVDERIVSLRWEMNTSLVKSANLQASIVGKHWIKLLIFVLLTMNKLINTYYFPTKSGNNAMKDNMIRANHIEGLEAI